MILENIKNAIYIIVLAVMLTACSSPMEDATAQISRLGITHNEITPVSMTSYTESSYEVFFEKDGYTLRPEEPLIGCYIGSYVLKNQLLDYDMIKYDELTGKHHALSMYNMKLGDEFPYDWMLECISNIKTPYIVIHPPNDYVPFHDALLEATAKAFAELKVPIFVDFYPTPQMYTDNPERYIDFYRKARSAFKTGASNCIFVFSADSQSVYDFDMYYPGDDYTDWVGINIYNPLFVNGERNMRDPMKDLDFFYAMYQHRKPLIVSQLAYSSYSTKDNKYSSPATAKKLTAFYTAVKDNYPRIKAVNYMDFNNIDGAPPNAYRDNFSVTQDETVLKAYRDVVSDDYFLSESVQIASQKDLSTKIIQTYKSYFTVYEDENFQYISKKAFELEFGKLPDAETLQISGEDYYSMQKLLQCSKVKCTVIEEINKIVIAAS